MARDGWLEQRTRIPFAGIVAMVVIVAVVAIFLRTGLQSLLPESNVTVQSADDFRENSRGSASYVGERDIPLVYKERLYGILSSNEGSRTFLIDVPARALTLTRGKLREDVVLQPSNAGASLAAQFEHDGQNVQVLITPADRVLVWHVLQTFPVDVALTDVVTHEGFFLYHGKQYLFKYHLNGRYAEISSGGSTDHVPLELTGEELIGTWYDDDQTKHPVVVQPRKFRAVVGELW